MTGTIDDNNTIELLMRQDLGKWILRQRSGGAIVRKAAAKIPINVGQFYTIRITFNGSAFTVGIDANATAITMNPGAAVLTGTIGYRVKAATPLHRIKCAAPPADRFLRWHGKLG